MFASENALFFVAIHAGASSVQAFFSFTLMPEDSIHSEILYGQNFCHPIRGKHLLYARATCCRARRDGWPGFFSSITDCQRDLIVLFFHQNQHFSRQSLGLSCEEASAYKAKIDPPSQTLSFHATIIGPTLLQTFVPHSIKSCRSGQDMKNLKNNAIISWFKLGVNAQGTWRAD